jgi:Domain of unknown function (DUF4055)
MSLEYTNPAYDLFREDWSMMRDFYVGERAVKSAGTTYLPPTQSMILDGMGLATTVTTKRNIGQEAYDAYRLRAVFPDYVKEAVEAYIGLLHQKPPTIELPPEMEFMRDKATLHGESLIMLLRRINEEQLVTGRVGLLLDMPVAPDPANPGLYVATYAAETIPNWDDGEALEGTTKLNLVVLNESGVRRKGFEWKAMSKYRVLSLEPILEPNATDPEAPPVVTGTQYMVGVFENEGGLPVYAESDMRTPMLRGQVLDEIPFVFVNSKDIVATPDQPPLMGLARLCRAIYCGEADFRQNLFMQGQDTLVIIGDRKKRTDFVEGGTEEAMRTGAGSMIELESGAGNDAKYVGVTAEGLSAQQETLADDRNRAEARSGQLISAKEQGIESGAALKTRVAGQTATLNQLALTGAAALQAILRIAAKWMNANVDKVIVTPNLEFSDFEMTGESLVKLMTARTMGAPISLESIHGLMVDQGLTKLDYETEMDKIAEEDANDPRLTGTDAGGDPEDEDTVQGGAGDDTLPGGEDE